MRAPFFSVEKGGHSFVEGEQLSRVLAVLSALALAGLYWHLTFSRYGVESNLVPLFEVLTFCFLWRGFRVRTSGPFVLAGVFLGLSLYTYQAARMLPFLLTLFVIYRLAVDRRQFVRAYWKGIVLTVLAAIVTFAPLGYYFLRHPAALTLRTGQVAVLDREQGAAMLANNVPKVTAMFLVRGDEDPRSNLPGRPVLDYASAVPFLLGMGLVLAGLHRPQYAFLALWLVVMVAPSALSEHAPHFRRALGATPVVAMAVALGLAGVLTAGFWLAERIRGLGGRALRALAVLAVVSAVASSALLTYRDYFLVWGRSNDLFAAFDVGIIDVVRYANSIPDDVEVFLSPIPRSHPTIEFSFDRRQQLRSFDGRRGFMPPSRSDVDAVYIVVTHEDSRSLSLLRRHFPLGRPVYEGASWDGRPYFTSYLVPAGSQRSMAPSYAARADLGNKVAFLGYDTPRLAYKPGDVIPLVLYWQSVEAMKESFTVFAHLLGPWDDKNKTIVWGQQDGIPLGGTLPTNEWAKGVVVLDELAIPIRSDAPPGDYEIEIGMYLLATMERLPVVDPVTGKQIDDRVVLEKVRVE